MKTIVNFPKMTNNGVMQRSLLMTFGTWFTDIKIACKYEWLSYYTSLTPKPEISGER
jgi:hypothetical protein